jgi:hypothetical protein
MPLDQPRTDAVAALSRAETCLIQSEECRIGYLRDSFIRDAVGYLHEAGRSDLADRLDDDPWGADAGAILREVTKARAV